MVEATQIARTARRIPDGLVAHLVEQAAATPDQERVARGRRHQRFRTFDNTDVVRQVATELLRVSAGL